MTDETELTPEQHEFDLDYIGGKTVLMQSPEKFINHSCDPIEDLPFLDDGFVEKHKQKILDLRV